MTTLITLPVAALTLLLASAAMDAKTGVLTHRAWQRAATHAITTTRRPGPRSVRWALLMLDLDHFNRLNSDYGHPTADDVLHHVATTLRAATTPDAVIGRFGGDEFTILLRVADHADLYNRAEHLRRAVEAATVTCTAPSGQIMITGVTASIGGAIDFGSCTRPSAETSALADLLWTSDRALYDAKRAGRNTIRIRVINGR